MESCSDKCIFSTFVLSEMMNTGMIRLSLPNSVNKESLKIAIGSTNLVAVVYQELFHQ